MAISANCVCEVRGQTGSDNNGGGFVIGSSGIDYSQQASPQYALTGLTTAAANAIILTSSASSDMVGNLIRITGGTNFTVGTYQILSVVVGVSITVDSNCTTAAGAAGTANIGGCWATLGAALARMPFSSKVFVKADGTYSMSATASCVNGGFPGLYARVIGYTTTRGDNGKATIQASGTGYALITTNVNGWSFENLIIDCNSKATSTGIVGSGSYWRVINCIVKNFTSYGIQSTGLMTAVTNTEVTGGITGATVAIAITSGHVSNSYIHDNVCSGIYTSGNGGAITKNIISNNSGASSDGIQLQGYAYNVTHNTIHKSGRHGINFNYSYNIINDILNNVLSSNGGYGLKGVTVPAEPWYDGNAYYNNTSGTRSLCDDTSGVNSVAPYTNSHDVTLSGDPFVNAAGNNYALNSTAGAGAACRAVGMPSTWLNGSTTAYSDMGAVQHQDSGGGSGGALSRQFLGMGG